MNIKIVVALGMMMAAVHAAEIEKNYTVTAYCSCEKCCGKWSAVNKTADGHTPREGITIAAPRSIPFGTKLHIEGVGVRTVQDRLSPKYDNRIDVYFSDHNRALQFGKKTLKVKKVS
jgi:3D (Asp-Asp-Asp) domain-containing protein